MPFFKKFKTKIFIFEYCPKIPLEMNSTHPFYLFLIPNTSYVKFSFCSWQKSSKREVFFILTLILNLFLFGVRFYKSNLYIVLVFLLYRRLIRANMYMYIICFCYLYSYFSRGVWMISFIAIKENLLWIYEWMNIK